METRDAASQCSWTGGVTGPQGAWPLGTVEAIPRPRPRGVVHGPRVPEMFGTTLVSVRRRKSVVWMGVQVSLIVHGLLGAGLVLAPTLFPDLPAAKLHDPFGTVFFAPPPPPPPPHAPRATVRPLTKPTIAVPVDPRPEALKIPDVFDAPPDVIGMPEGIEGGVEGGVVGGTLGGVVGGVIGGTGTGPVPEAQPDRPARPLKLSKPRYPQEAFVKRIEGTVELEILIDHLGRVVEARVTKSIPLLDVAAVETVRQWLFTPAVKDGHPVASRARAPVTFRIH